MRENGHSGFRSKILEILRPRVGAFAVENVVDAGPPDVCCTLGWIELKVASTPARSTTRVNFGMRPSQRVWHIRWREFGGRSWTLCRLEDTNDDLPCIVMMHDGHWSAAHMDTAIASELQRSAIGWWIDQPSDEELISAMMRPLPKIMRG